MAGRGDVRRSTLLVILICLPISADWSLPRADGSMIFTDDENDSNK